MQCFFWSYIKKANEATFEKKCFLQKTAAPVFKLTLHAMVLITLQTKVD